MTGGISPARCQALLPFQPISLPRRLSTIRAATSAAVDFRRMNLIRVAIARNSVKSARGGC